MFSLSVFVVKSIVREQSQVYDVKNVKKDPASYSLLWAPSDITVTFKKDFQTSNQISQGRALTQNITIKNQTLPAETKVLSSSTASSTAIKRKTRTNDSLSRVYSGN